MLVPYTITSLRNIYGWSPWHQQCPALTSCGDLSRHSGHRQDDCNCGVFAISCHTKLFLGLCNINEWWIGGHRSHTLAHHRGGHGLNVLIAVTYNSQSNSKLYLQKNNHIPTPHPPSRTCPLKTNINRSFCPCCCVSLGCRHSRHDIGKVSNIRRTKSKNLNASRLGLQLSLRNILKPTVKWRMKM